MILTKEFLNTVSLKPNSDNELVANKLARLREFSNMVKELNIVTVEMVEKLISIIKSSDKNDRISFCKILEENSTTQNTYKKIFLYSQFFEIYLISIDYIDFEEFTILMNAFYKIDNQLKTIANTDNIDKTSQDYSAIKFNAALSLIRAIGRKLVNINNEFNQFPTPMSYRYTTSYDSSMIFKSIPKVMMEAINADTEAGAEGMTVDTGLDTKEFVEFIEKIIKNPSEYESEFIVSKFKCIPEYYKAYVKLNSSKNSLADLRDDISDSCSPYALMYICFDSIKYNNRDGLIELNSAFDKTIYELANMSHTSFEGKELANDIIEGLSRIQVDISAIIAGNRQETNPITEMGFGYIYDIFPYDITAINESTIENILSALDKYSETHNSISLLTEGIVKDEYEFVQRKRLDRYEFKKQKKQDKYEASKKNKEESMEAEKESKDMKMDISADKLKAMTLTDDSMYKVYGALKRAIAAAVVAGGLSLVNINPIVGACLYLIPKYLNSTKFANGATGKSKERSKAIAEINAHIAKIETRLDEADRKGNYKAKADLEKLKTRLETTRNRIAADVQSKGGALIL